MSMRFFFLILFGYLCFCSAFAQNTAISKKLTIIKSKNGVYQSESSDPPLLDIVPNSIKFVDIDGNNCIDANEKCELLFQVKNSGKGEGKRCKVKLSAEGSTRGLKYSDINLPDIPAGKSIDVQLPIEGNINTEDGKVNLLLSIEESRGFGSTPLTLSVETHSFIPPLVRVTDYSITSEQGVVINRRVPFDLQVLVQNIQPSIANDVKMSIELPNNVILMEGSKDTQLGSLRGGGMASVTYSLVVNNSYRQPTIPITFKLVESYGKYAENKTINLRLNQNFSATKINIESRNSDKNIAIAQIEEKNRQADVDIEIPKTDTNNENTFVVIIANENYQTEASVPYSINDGLIFAAYCNQTLGIPEKNIHFRQDATLNNMKAEIDWLSKVMQVYEGNAKAIFYYAGHGIPDEKDKTAYLLPIDGIGSNISTGYALEILYSELGNIPSQSITIFLDACFSGAKREDGMLLSSRGVVIKVNSAQPKGRIVVFSAAQGNETAYPYKECSHGLFTYYLLKGLQKSKGDITIGELSEYVKEKVRKRSIVVNGKLQTPTIIPSATLGDTWKKWKLK